jgi:hypothetical protein
MIRFQIKDLMEKNYRNFFLANFFHSARLFWVLGILLKDAFCI